MAWGEPTPIRPGADLAATLRAIRRERAFVDEGLCTNNEALKAIDKLAADALGHGTPELCATCGEEPAVAGFRCARCTRNIEEDRDTAA